MNRVQNIFNEQLKSKKGGGQCHQDILIYWTRQSILQIWAKSYPPPSPQMNSMALVPGESGYDKHDKHTCESFQHSIELLIPLLIQFPAGSPDYWAFFGLYKSGKWMLFGCGIASPGSGIEEQCGQIWRCIVWRNLISPGNPFTDVNVWTLSWDVSKISLFSWQDSKEGQINTTNVTHISIIIHYFLQFSKSIKLKVHSNSQ